MHLGLKKRRRKEEKKKNGLERAVSLCENSSRKINRGSFVQRDIQQRQQPTQHTTLCKGRGGYCVQYSLSI